MVAKKSNHWNKEADQALLNLLKIYGDHRWAEIARQLKEIYKFDYTPNVVLQRWNRLNPQSYKKPWNHEEELEFFEHIKKHGNNWTMIQNEMPRYGYSKLSSRNTNQLRARFQSIFRRNFRKLNLTIGKLENIKPAVFMKLLSLAHEPQLELKEEGIIKTDLYQYVIRSCKKLILLIEVVFKSENWNNRSVVYEQLLKITDRDEVQLMFEHLFLLNTMHQVEHSMIIPSENQQHQLVQNREHGLLKRRKKMCGVRTWDEADALTDPYQMDSDSDEQEEVSEDNKQFKYGQIKQEFSQQEILLLKESVLYKKLFQNERKQFFDLYNSALQPNKDNTFLLNLQDMSMLEGVKKEEKGKRNINNHNQVKIQQPKEGDKEFEVNQSKVKKIKYTKKLKSKLNTKIMQDQPIKFEVKIKRTKRSKQTFRDRYTMFRDEDYMKQEQDDQDYGTKKIKGEINGVQLDQLFNDMIETNAGPIQLTKKVEYTFEQEFTQLFDL